MIRSADYWPVWDQRHWPVSNDAPDTAMGRLLIIDAREGTLRLSCDVCGSHVIHDSSTIDSYAICPVCGEFREVPERRVGLRLV